LNHTLLRIAKATHLPIMLYNIPGRSVVNLLPESVVELSKVKNIVAIKEASGQLEQMAEMIANTGDDFSLYSGDDSMTLPALAIGAKGVVSVVSHIAGNEMKRLITSFFAHRTEQAARLHRDLLPLMKAMFIAPNPTCVKTALQLRGLDVGGVRLPLVPLSEAERKTVARQLKLLDKLSY
ncbi:MAG TPA: 4-hydroxy-tetrahydrodipicolinate synthase, partial [Bacilli bacterium]|nr:4-hydroxy-tetrahydrodipicolinate synthase [Bacilli bacterium]